jgi:transposase
MSEKFTVSDFMREYPDNDACIEKIKNDRFGNQSICQKCKKLSRFYKVAGRTAYACQFCGNHMYPLAGTIFDKTTTPLTSWFYAIYLMAQTRAGISAKQLERELGVTYKTAWRMFHQIRKLMADDSDLLDGKVEVDVAYSHPNPERRSTAKPHNSQVVFGMVERGGRAKVRHVKSSGARVLLPTIRANVAHGAKVYSDEWRSYDALDKLGYSHATINHSERVYVRGDMHTQNIENLWSNIKRGITGVYRHVDAQYLQSYIDEYAFRYSNRFQSAPMFNLLLERVAITS